MSRLFYSYSSNEPGSWRLEVAYIRLTSIGLITVPAGFTWDGPSVPGWLRSIVPIWAPYSPAALIHDYLYTIQVVNRRMCDLIFWILLVEDGIGSTSAYIIWLTVRICGRKHWKE